MSVPRPRILAHRGASGQAPENSLLAFEKARALGADGVELDIHTTSDGVLVVHHDAEIPGAGPIRSLPYRRLHGVRLPSGEALPTLEAALAVLAGLEVWIEVKYLPPDRDGTLLTLLDRQDPSRVGIHSFDHRIVSRLGGARPGLRRGILSASYPLDLTGPMRAAGARWLWQEWHLIDAELVAAVHRTGGEVIAWTVPDAPEAQQLAALGVDALCGNYPDRLRLD